jgi:hypothetical protein
VNNRLIRNTVAVSVVAAVGAVSFGFATGQLKNAFALAIGLLVGSANGLLVQRSLALGVGFTAVSLVRLLVLTGLGLGIGLLIGVSQVWLVVGGIAIAQLVLAGFAVREALAG